MPLYVFYTMVQKSQKWTKTQIKGGGGGPALSTIFQKLCQYNYIFDKLTDKKKNSAIWR